MKVERKKVVFTIKIQHLNKDCTIFIKDLTNAKFVVLGLFLGFLFSEALPVMVRAFS